MKKVLMVFSLFLVMILGACNSISDDKLIKDYVKDTYGIDIVINNSDKNMLELGQEKYYVSPVDHQHIKFSVIVDSYSPEDKSELNYRNKYLITDNYSIALKTDKELHKLDKVIPDIKKLGFNESFNDENRVFFAESGKEDIWSFLYSTSHFEKASIEKDLDRLFEVHKLIKQSGALFDLIIVSDMRNLNERNSYILDLKKLKDVNTKEDFLLEMKKTNANIANFYENKK
ncbi:hypothetical protein [Lysinibacillus xylanilyticus]|uniref:hypothetical protein n=1 Tax=Lysinibacillus xylanilyticus TaxID=582475 RepID=UPI003D97DD1F